MRTLRRFGQLLLWVVVLVGAFVAGRWALDETAAPAPPVTSNGLPVTYRVEVGTVGHTLDLVAVAEWPVVSTVLGGARGTVTTIGVVDGEVVQNGDVILTVDLRPVVVAEGSVPAFRDLRPGAEGDDVAQLQRLLADLGYLESEIDGGFGPATRSAVRAWQRDLDIPDDGFVRRGDVLFVPGLPNRIVLADGLSVGGQVSIGDAVMMPLADAPVFWIPLSLDQRRLVPFDAGVRIHDADMVWEARVIRVEEYEERNELRHYLAGTAGQSVCGVMCTDRVSLGVDSEFPVEVEVTQEMTGPVVPVAGIWTSVTGSTYVRLLNGDQHDITILTSHAGLAVVEGLEPGMEIRLPGASP